jgi:Helix-turn-helix domain
VSKSVRFARVPIQASWDRSLGTQAFRVLVAIAIHVNDVNGTAYPSITLLQRLTGIKRQNVSAAIKTLERLAYLSRSPGHAGSRGGRIVYTLNYADQSSCPGMTDGRATISSSDMTVAPGPACARMTSEHTPSSCADMRGVIPWHDNASFPGMMPSEQPKKQPRKQPKNAHEHPAIQAEARQRRIPLTDSIDAEFAEWWQLLPKKIDKADASRLFRQARAKKRISWAKLRTSMSAYAQQFAPLGPNDPQYSTGPAKWLRGERWNDEAPGGDRPTAEFNPNPGRADRHDNGGGLMAAVKRRYADLSQRTDE